MQTIWVPPEQVLVCATRAAAPAKRNLARSSASSDAADPGAFDVRADVTGDLHDVSIEIRARSERTGMGLRRRLSPPDMGEA
jgi:hypothetical protein